MADLTTQARQERPTMENLMLTKWKPQKSKIDLPRCEHSKDEQNLERQLRDDRLNFEKGQMTKYGKHEPNLISLPNSRFKLVAQLHEGQLISLWPLLHPQLYEKIYRRWGDNQRGNICKTIYQRPGKGVWGLSGSGCSLRQKLWRADVLHLFRRITLPKIPPRLIRGEWRTSLLTWSPLRCPMELRPSGGPTVRSPYSPPSWSIDVMSLRMMQNVFDR